jgi:hypothetical protein
MNADLKWKTLEERYPKLKPEIYELIHNTFPGIDMRSLYEITKDEGVTELLKQRIGLLQNSIGIQKRELKRLLELEGENETQ